MDSIYPPPAAAEKYAWRNPLEVLLRLCYHHFERPALASFMVAIMATKVRFFLFLTSTNAQQLTYCSLYPRPYEGRAASMHNR
jgi:hypothetical protein